MFLSQVALLCSWGYGASSWEVRAHPQSGLIDEGYPVQHCFAVPSLFPEKRAWASKDSSPSLAETGTVTWLWLRVRDKGTGEHGLKSQCIAALVAHSHPHKAIKKVKFTDSKDWVSPSVAVMLLTYFVILLRWVSFFLCLTLTSKEKKSSSNFKSSDSFQKLLHFLKHNLLWSSNCRLIACLKSLLLA